MKISHFGLIYFLKISNIFQMQVWIFKVKLWLKISANNINQSRIAFHLFLKIFIKIANGTRKEGKNSLSRIWIFMNSVKESALSAPHTFFIVMLWLLYTVKEKNITEQNSASNFESEYFWKILSKSGEKKHKW